MQTFKTKKGTELPIMSIQGKPYLQTGHRILWFREELPGWSIETELISVSPTECLAKAIIKDESGRVIATAHKAETPKGFADYIEKAETGAIGRALAMCGYGTQFTANELEEGQRLADSPIAKPQSPASVHPAFKGAQQKVEQELIKRKSDPTSNATIHFGKNKGKALWELTDKQIDWYYENAMKSTRRSAQDEELLANLQIEKEKRHPAANSKDDSPAALVHEFGPPPIPFDEQEQIPF